jgi:hypothetical protein
MRGREGDCWREEIADKPLPEMVRALVEAGFRGIFIDRAGCEELAGKLEPPLTQLLGEKPLVSRHWRYYFYDLTAYAARLRQEAAPKDPSPPINPTKGPQP